MAISRVLGICLMRWVAGLGLSGRLVTLGRYNMWFDAADVEGMAGQAGFAMRDRPAPERDIGPNRRLAGPAFFRALGFTELVEVDLFDRHPGVYRFDLNRAETPLDLVDTADAVFDLGTSEHVFHLPHVLGHIGRMLRTGGVVIHHTPANNQINHGFYQFSPTLYADYYAANRYRIEYQALNLTEGAASDRQEFLALDAAAAARPLEVVGAPEAFNVLVARKTSQSTNGVWPQQRFYVTAAG